MLIRHRSSERTLIPHTGLRIQSSLRIHTRELNLRHLHIVVGRIVCSGFGRELHLCQRMVECELHLCSFSLGSSHRKIVTIKKIGIHQVLLFGKSRRCGIADTRKIGNTVHIWCISSESILVTGDKVFNSTGRPRSGVVRQLHINHPTRSRRGSPVGNIDRFSTENADHGIICKCIDRLGARNLRRAEINRETTRSRSDAFVFGSATCASKRGNGRSKK